MLKQEKEGEEARAGRNGGTTGAATGARKRRAREFCLCRSPHIWLVYHDNMQWLVFCDAWRRGEVGGVALRLVFQLLKLKQGRVSGGSKTRMEDSTAE